jgi:hypothetical protein
MKRLSIASSAVLLFTLVFASPTLAAAPDNDVIGGAVVIPAIPYADTSDTTEATTDASDEELNAQCGAPATDASVWYSLTTAVDTAVLVDVSASSYPAGVLVGVGAPGSFGIVTCGPGGSAFLAAAGETYWILVIDDQSDGGGNGGTLELSVSELPPLPDVDITVDPVGTFNSRTGSATITGTVICSPDAVVFIDAQVRQAVGRFTVSGFGFTELLCDGTEQSWSMEVFGETGKFKGGKAMSVVFAAACSFDCGFDSEEATIRLRK